jgi:hypothetical protein
MGLKNGSFVRTVLFIMGQEIALMAVVRQLIRPVIQSKTIEIFQAEQHTLAFATWLLECSRSVATDGERSVGIGISVFPSIPCKGKAGAIRSDSMLSSICWDRRLDHRRQTDEMRRSAAKPIPVATTKKVPTKAVARARERM